MKIKEYLQYERFYSGFICGDCRFKSNKIIYCYINCHKISIKNNNNPDYIKAIINFENRLVRLFTHED